MKGLRERVESEGVVVIPGVLKPQECEAARDGAWNMVETLTQRFAVPVSRQDESTWKSFYDLMPMHGMLLQHWRVGHAQWVWDIRQNPRVVDVFAQIWGTEDLLVSYDGVSFAPRHEVTKRGHYKQNDWFHSDQNYEDTGLECVQGWVTTNDVRTGDATLTYFSNSHKLHGDFAKAFPESVEKSKRDWFQLSDAHCKWYLDHEGCEIRTVECPAGSLVLWDSRTIHAGKEALPSRAEPNDRIVAYVCCTPRSHATSANVKKHIKYFEEMRMTTHWPHKVRVFGKFPWTRGAPLPDVPELPKPMLTELGMKLVGYNTTEPKEKRLKK